MPREAIRKLEDISENELEQSVASEPVDDVSKLDIVITDEVVTANAEEPIYDTPTSSKSLRPGFISTLPTVTWHEKAAASRTEMEFTNWDKFSDNTFRYAQENKRQSSQLMSIESKFLRDPSKWNIRFEGFRSAIPVERFFYRVERIAEKANIPLNQLVDLMSFVLTNEALDWYWLFIERHPHASWDNFKAEMIQRFKSNRTDDDIISMINQRKQLYPKESFQEYHDAIIKMSLLAKDSLSDREIYHILKRNMRPGLQLELSKSSGFSSLSSFVRECIELEDRWRRFGYNPEAGMSRFNFQPQAFNNRSNPRVNEVWQEDFENISYSQENNLEDDNYYSEQSLPLNSYQLNAFRNPNHVPSRSFDRNTQYVKHTSEYKPNSKIEEVPVMSERKRLECWNCGAPDHGFFDCRQARRVFCYGCGAKGIFKPDCVRCSLNQGNRKRDSSTSRNLCLANSTTDPSMMISTKIEAASNTDPELYRMQK